MMQCCTCRLELIYDPNKQEGENASKANGIHIVPCDNTLSKYFIQCNDRKCKSKVSHQIEFGETQDTW